MSVETIYVALVERESDALRPVQAMRRADGLFEIVSRNDDPESEPWQFAPGSLVRCERQLWNGHPHWVAVALEAPRTPRLVR